MGFRFRPFGPFGPFGPFRSFGPFRPFGPNPPNKFGGLNETEATKDVAFFYIKRQSRAEDGCNLLFIIDDLLIEDILQCPRPEDYAPGTGAGAKHNGALKNILKKFEK